MTSLFGEGKVVWRFAALPNIWVGERGKWMVVGGVKGGNGWWGAGVGQTPEAAVIQRALLG